MCSANFGVCVLHPIKTILTTQARERQSLCNRLTIMNAYPPKPRKPPRLPKPLLRPAGALLRKLGRGAARSVERLS